MINPIPICTFNMYLLCFVNTIFYLKGQDLLKITEVMKKSSEANLKTVLLAKIGAINKDNKHTDLTHIKYV